MDGILEGSKLDDNYVAMHLGNVAIINNAKTKILTLTRAETTYP